MGPPLIRDCIECAIGNGSGGQEQWVWFSWDRTYMVLSSCNRVGARLSLLDLRIPPQVGGEPLLAVGQHVCLDGAIWCCRDLERHFDPPGRARILDVYQISSRRVLFLLTLSLISPPTRPVVPTPLR